MTDHLYNQLIKADFTDWQRFHPMKPPPLPLIPSGLSENCSDVIGIPLVLKCENGWGWTHECNGVQDPFNDERLTNGQCILVPESYIEFQSSPRCGVFGSVLNAPEGYQFQNILAFIMSDGLDFDFTDNIAPAWRVMLGDGQPDFESAWFPVLSGESVYYGYGAIGLTSKHLEAMYS